jgi:hypothetical protein
VLGSNCFLTIFVDAKHLDYSDTLSFLHSLTLNQGKVGHAWIYVEGMIDGKKVTLEGGHSGELGITQAKYFDGIMNYLDYGYANPKPFQKMHRRYEPNPIKYLWEDLHDGFFQTGPGSHTPTYAAKVKLTKEQFLEILDFIQSYSYSIYSITRHQCCTFVSQVAAIAGLELPATISMHLEPNIYFRGTTIRLWKDAAYEQILFESPDVLEQSLKHIVEQGKAEKFSNTPNHTENP